MFAQMLTNRTICKPGPLALALSGLLLLAPAPAWAQAAKDVNCPSGCVDSSDIRDGTISAADIGTGAVDSRVILDKSVTSADISPGAVTSAHITPGAVTNAALAPNAVQGGNIADGSVTSLDLAPGVLNIHAVGDSGSIVIPAAAFQPEDEMMVYDLSLGGYIRPGALSTAICVQAPVFLPNGVTVTHLEAIVWDNSNTQSVGVGLKRVSIFGSGYKVGAYDTGCYDVTPDFSYCTQPPYVSNQGAVAEMATATTSALGPLDQVVAVIHTITAGTEVVDTDSFAYSSEHASPAMRAVPTTPGFTPPASGTTEYGVIGVTMQRPNPLPRYVLTPCSSPRSGKCKSFR